MNSMASHENANPKPSAIILSLPEHVIYTILSKLPMKYLFTLRSVCKSLLSLISNPDFVRAHDMIMYKIFLLLPVKDLSRLMSVCKSWLSLISSRDFANAHLSESTNDPRCTHHHLFLNMGGYDLDGYPDVESHGFVFKSLSIHSLLNEPVTEDIDLDCPIESPCHLFIVGYCHGLICLTTWLRSYCAHEGRDIVYEHVCLWNPCTGKSRILPKFDEMLVSGRDIVHGFCYDESNDDFKVVTIFGPEEFIFGHKEFKVSVYSLKSDSWRIIGDFSFWQVCKRGDFSFRQESKDRYGKFANGAIHWGIELPYPYPYHDRLQTIVSLDIKTEMFREVGLPNYNGEITHISSLGTFDKSLSILYKFETYADLWVMKEYGLGESWTKLFTIPYPDETLRYLDYPTITSISVNGNIILNFGCELSMKLYHRKEKTFQNLFHDDVHVLFLYEVDTYVESLVSPHL